VKQSTVEPISSIAIAVGGANPDEKNSAIQLAMAKDIINLNPNIKSNDTASTPSNPSNCIIEGSLSSFKFRSEDLDTALENICATPYNKNKRNASEIGSLETSTTTNSSDNTTNPSDMSKDFTDILKTPDPPHKDPIPNLIKDISKENKTKKKKDKKKRLDPDSNSSEEEMPL